MMPCFQSARTCRVVRAVLAVGVVAISACGTDNPVDVTPQPPKGIVVLDGFIQPGLTLLSDTGAQSARIIFGATTEFDAGGFSLVRDTVLSVSSRAAGDLLYVADIASRAVRRIQLPPASNPSRARLLVGSGGQSLIGVALRDSASVALVSVRGTAVPTITRIANAGTCPTDVFQFDNATWVVDANANCRGNYAAIGDVRLIRIPATGSTRDTLTIPGMRGSGAAAVVVGEVAYISGGGDANFSAFPYTLLASGRVAKVDLRNRRVLSQRSMPAMSYGAGVKLGGDGFLYASLYADLTTFKNRVIKLRADDLSIVTTTAEPWMTLLNTAGSEVACGSAVADALGRVHCLVNGAASATTLWVFDVSGREVRRASAGQGGVDLAIR